ncbi:hypothetical protein SAMN00808754_1492 [Thermanaeromonas toyohensis ToBE]|uniref:Uncharacterized protein n=1 Tax=Thermanaeromonas toyohensis ToBE TaxID=698762 RepID=A0A1W1VU85_9FIRM|nr:hypothetical protein SAMN00808754_1492 [Thermanaeromonas toyohensis ToBE]
MIVHDDLEKFLKAGSNLWWPAFMTDAEYIKDWLLPFVESCQKRGIPTYKALVILEAMKRSILYVSKVELPPGGRWYW